MNVRKERLMKCPTCPDTALVMADRQGVEIDYCPKMLQPELSKRSIEHV